LFHFGPDIVCGALCAICYGKCLDSDYYNTYVDVVVVSELQTEVFDFE